MRISLSLLPSGRSFARIAAALALAAAVACSNPASAQFGGGGGGGGVGGGGGGGLGGGGGGGLGGGGGGGGGGGLGGGGGGGGGGFGSGVVIDADGVVHRSTVADPDGRLARQRVAEAMNRLEGDLAKPSTLRKVSLTRLEDAVAQRLAAGESPTDAMQNLAGLTRIDYVFCYPETGEIVLAGPAEPWALHPSGRVLGIESASPVIELRDLVTALRAFAPASAPEADPLIYCSIDPTEEGLAGMQEFLVRFGRSATPAQTGLIVSKLQEALGPQAITVGGVPADTHFAQVLVEADYRMKLIGIGLEQPAAPIQSYVSRVNPAAVSRNALQRWYFVPEYDRLKATDDGLAVEIVGDGVRLVGEDEVVSKQGGRQQLGRTNRHSNAFVNEFTAQYDRLAAASPVYAQLRNCIDLAVAAAFMADRDYFSQAGWDMPVFGDEARFPVRTENAPQTVSSAVNAIWKGSTLMTPIGGGVMIRPSEALQADRVAADADGKLAEGRDAVATPADALRWWWD